jgi:hypothetical protein
MSFLEANLSALGGRFPELAAFAAGKGADGRLVVEAAKSGAASASLGGMSLHSRYDPESEAERQAASIPESVSACVFYGFGLGYLPRAFLASHPESVAIVVEPEIGFLRAAMESVDLNALLKDERLSFLIGTSPEALIKALDDLGAEKPERLPLKAYQNAYPDYFEACDRALKRYEAKRLINDATLRRFGGLWVRNLSRNLAWMGRAPGISRLTGLFSGMPALVVAAGPSLDRILPRLPELALSHLIVAVDTAARSVQRSGVDPDFCVVVDPQFWNVRHLDGFDSSKSILISESAVHPAVLRRAWRAVYLCSSIFPLGSFIEKRLGDPGKLGAGGSVATSAWDFARICGASPVLMAGLDLGFPGRGTHSRDSYFEARALMRGCRLAPAELDSFMAFRAAEPYLAPDNSGAQVHTDRRMALYSWWFEAKLAQADSVPTRNLSARGLAISGMPYAPLESFLGLAELRPRIDKILGDIASARVQNGQGFKAAFHALLEALRSLKLTASLAAQDSETAIGKLKAGKNVREELDALSRRDAELLGNPAKEVISFLFPSVGSLYEGKPESLEKVLENGAKVYREAAKQAEYHLDILNGRAG